MSTNVVDSGWLDDDVTPTIRIKWRTEQVNDETTPPGVTLFDSVTGLFDEAPGAFDSH